jgi:hypothetical protein
LLFFLVAVILAVAVAVAVAVIVAAAAVAVAVLILTPPILGHSTALPQVYHTGHPAVKSLAGLVLNSF